MPPSVIDGVCASQTGTTTLPWCADLAFLSTWAQAATAVALTRKETGDQLIHLG